MRMNGGGYFKKQKNGGSILGTPQTAGHNSTCTVKISQFVTKVTRVKCGKGRSIHDKYYNLLAYTVSLILPFPLLMVVNVCYVSAYHRRTL